jgi:hypothetical protein
VSAIISRNSGIVGQHGAVAEVDPLAVDIHMVDRALVVADARAKLAGPGAHDGWRAVLGERHEEQARLIDVTVVAVHDRDLRLVGELAPQPVRGQRSGGPAAEDHNSLHHDSSLARRRGGRPRPKVPASATKGLSWARSSTVGRSPGRR